MPTRRREEYSFRVVRVAVELFTRKRGSFTRTKRLCSRLLLSFDGFHLEIIGCCGRASVGTGNVKRLDALVHRRFEMTPFHLHK